MQQRIYPDRQSVWVAESGICYRWPVAATVAATGSSRKVRVLCHPGPSVAVRVHGGSRGIRPQNHWPKSSTNTGFPKSDQTHCGSKTGGLLIRLGSKPGVGK